MTDTDIEMRLRNSLRELTQTTPLVNPERPPERLTGAPVSAVPLVGNDLGRQPAANWPSSLEHRARPIRAIVVAVAVVVAVAAFAFAVADGPGSSDQRASVPAARVQSARQLAATVAVRARDLPGWSGFTSPAPDPAALETVARCMGRQGPRLAPPVAALRSKEFAKDNLTVDAQSYTYVMATAAEAAQVTSLERQPRFPWCDASLESKAIEADAASPVHLSALKVVVGPAPAEVEQADSLTVTTTYSTQQVGATGASDTDAHMVVVRSGRVLTDVVVSALLSAGPFPLSLFDRLAGTVSKRLTGATRTAKA
jgi:hypothetical protein